MELHHPPVNLKVVTVIFGQALGIIAIAAFYIQKKPVESWVNDS